MHVQLWQMLLIIAYGFFINYDKNGTMIGTSQPVTAGLIVGLIMGDLNLRNSSVRAVSAASSPQIQTRLFSACPASITI